LGFNTDARAGLAIGLGEQLLAVGNRGSTGHFWLTGESENGKLCFSSPSSPTLLPCRRLRQRHHITKAAGHEREIKILYQQYLEFSYFGL
jgi:hypothetical protein